LAIIMIGATTLGLIFGGVPMAALPFVIGLLATFVIYGRTRLAPLPARRTRGSAGAGSVQPAFPAGFSVSHASASRRELGYMVGRSMQAMSAMVLPLASVTMTPAAPLPMGSLLSSP